MDRDDSFWPRFRGIRIGGLGIIFFKSYYSNYIIKVKRKFIFNNKHCMINIIEINDL